MTILHQVLAELEFIKYKIDLLDPRKNLKIKNLVRSARENVSRAIAEIKSKIASDKKAEKENEDFNEKLSKEMFK